MWVTTLLLAHGALLVAGISVQGVGQVNRIGRHSLTLLAPSRDDGCPDVVATVYMKASSVRSTATTPKYLGILKRIQNRCEK